MGEEFFNSLFKIKDKNSGLNVELLLYCLIIKNREIKITIIVKTLSLVSLSLKTEKCYISKTKNRKLFFK